MKLRLFHLGKGSSMKFWELISVFRSDKEVLINILNEPRWVTYLEWYENINDHLNTQNRQVLDAELPNTLCRRALALSKHKFYIQDNVLREFKDSLILNPPYELLDALEVFDRFGGASIEEVIEYGSKKIQ